VRHKEETITTEDGATIFRQQWLPDDEPRAIVCLVHGLGEHSGRYGNVVDALTAEGLGVFSFDLRGHGKSSGGRGDLRVDDAMADIGSLIADAAAQVPDVPVIVYGHSLGGLLSMTYVVRNRPDIAAHVSTAPALDTQLRQQRLKLTVANLLSSVLPGIAVPTGVDASAISRDPEVVAAYEADPLVHDKASFALATQSLAAMEALREIKEYPVPLLLIQGTADTVVIPAATHEFAVRVEGDVVLFEYEGLYHEPHHEPERAEIFNDIKVWLNERLPDL
jgi:alpha-beta hydrolase superfamily lysophospholipase